MGDQYGIVNVKAFGAVGNGVKDDTAAIQSAITAATTAGGTVYIPSGDYLLSGSGAQLLLVQTGITIVGQNWDKTQLLIAASVPATTDLIRYYHPLAGPAFRNFALSDLRIIAVSGIPARHAVVVDTTDGAIAHARFARLAVYPLGGKAFYSVNPTLTDGFYLATIEECMLNGGVKLSRAGDSITLRHNAITGAGIGIEADFVIGATAFLIDSNNVTSAGPAIRIGLAQLVVIQNNNLETVAGGNYPAQPVIDILGDIAVRCVPYVVGNNIGALVADTDAIRLDYAYGAYIGPNDVTIYGSGAGVRTTVHTVDAKIDLDAIHWRGTSTTKVVDVSGQARSPAYVATGTLL
jgi:hypothetical protein